MRRLANGKWELNDDDMNFLSIALREAADHLGENGCTAIARTMQNIGIDIYLKLEESGFYSEAQTA